MDSLETDALQRGFRADVLRINSVDPDPGPALRSHIAELANWKEFALKMYKEKAAEFTMLRQTRDDLGSHYYDSENIAFSAQYKRANEQVKHLAEAANLADELLTSLERRRRFRDTIFLLHNGMLQGVMELDPANKYVGVILGNPKNLAPPDGYTPVRGTAKNLISSAISYYDQSLTDPAQLRQPLRLRAANNKVKKIYNHYGFDVVGNIGADTRRESLENQARNNGARLRTGIGMT